MADNDTPKSATSNLHPELVTTGKPLATGAVFRKVGMTTLPTTLAGLASMDCVGYISEDGIENGIDTSTEDKKVWGGDIVMSSLDEFKETYQFGMVENSPVVFGAVWGSDNVNGTDLSGLTVDHTSAAFNEIATWAIVTLVRDSNVCMHVIPKGQMSDLESITYDDTDLVEYKPTITALAGGFTDNPAATSRQYFFAVSN